MPRASLPNPIPPDAEELAPPGIRRWTILEMVFALTLLFGVAAGFAPYASAWMGVEIDSAFAGDLAKMGFGALVGLVGNAYQQS